MKNKTLAAWLALLGGPVGAHRFYLHGARDWLAWVLPILTALGVIGVVRARTFGLDDHWSWVLIPFGGFAIAGCALTAIVYGLTAPDKWRTRHPRGGAADASAAETSWPTVFAVVAALIVGATALMASLAFSFQRYFEYQMEQGQRAGR